MLNRLYGPVLKELSERFDPVVDDANVPGLAADDTALFQVLQGWREQVWRHAEMLGEAKTPEQRQIVARYIEEYALGIARQIRAGTTISDSSARDAHCAAYRRSHRETGGQARVVAPKRGLRARGRVAPRRVRVRVACPGPVRDCRPTVALTRAGRRLTRPRAFAVREGRSRAVGLRLTVRGRRLLARRPRPRVRVRAASPSPWGTIRRAVVRTRLRR